SRAISSSLLLFEGEILHHSLLISLMSHKLIDVVIIRIRRNIYIFSSQIGDISLTLLFCLVYNGTCPCSTKSQILGFLEALQPTVLRSNSCILSIDTSSFSSHFSRRHPLGSSILESSNLPSVLD